MRQRVQSSTLSDDDIVEACLALDSVERMNDWMARLISLLQDPDMTMATLRQALQPRL